MRLRRFERAAADRIDEPALQRLPLAAIVTVRFFKRDELTTDLLCCAVAVSGATYLFHEEMAGWDALLRHLEQLPGFDRKWFVKVMQPPFEPCETIAFSRA